jgi:hypothetical protein
MPGAPAAIPRASGAGHRCCCLVVVVSGHPMRWTINTTGFVLRRMSQLIESGARANKGFKHKDVNQVLLGSMLVRK